MIIAHMIKAPSDTNGNPRRGYFVYQTKPGSAYAALLGFFDIRFGDYSELRDAFDDIVLLGSVHVTVSEFKDAVTYTESAPNLQRRAEYSQPRKIVFRS